MKLRIILFGALILLAVLQCAYYYPKLPEAVACHYGGGSVADDWCSKESLIMSYLGILTVLTIFLGSLSFLHMPMGKDEWDAPKDPVNMGQGNPFFLVFGVMTLLWIIGLFQLILRANVLGRDRLEGSDLWFGIYLFGLAIWVVWILRKSPRGTWKRK
jgi:uncharacterized membrane protein